MDAPALDAVSGEIRSGFITGLVGPDGAGKTTLLRLIAGLLVPTTGRLSTLGHDPVHEAAAIHRELGYMPQKFGLYEDLSVLENLTLHADLRDVTGKERVETFARLLAFTDLQRFTGRFAGKLSGGMKQKLGLACALLGKPRLLLLDEPGVGVDPISRKELRNMVGRLVDEGIAVVWSTAYLEEAELCGTTLVLNEGKLIFSGAPDAMTAPLAGRCWQLKNPVGNKRRLLAQALSHPSISDGTIQGHHLRLTFRADAPAMPPDFPPEALGAPPATAWAAVAPRFEDAFIDRMGGGPGGDSVLARHVRAIPGDGEVVIEARQLTKKFGDFTATDAVTFQVRRGEIYGLLGPNGAGKSTTFNLVSGVLGLTSGTVKFRGETISGLPSRDIANRGMSRTFQHVKMIPEMTVLENVALGAQLRGSKNALSSMLRLDRAEEQSLLREAARQLERIGMGHALHEQAGNLAMGPQRLMEIARALCSDPALLLLDEPAAGLRHKEKQALAGVLRQLRSEGMSILLVEHDMDLVMDVTDHIVVMEFGTKLMDGTPAEVQQSPQVRAAYLGMEH